jgi:transcription termination factor Rho
MPTARPTTEGAKHQMSVLERSELEASPLADLHAIADQLGLDGFRRLRKAELIDAILAGARAGAEADSSAAKPPAERSSRRSQRTPRPRSRARTEPARDADGSREAAQPDGPSDVAEGIVELLDNGSAFLRVSPPDSSDKDVYISASQVRRCELISGDRVSGTVRRPRRSERHPSLVRVDTINGASADAVSDIARYEDLPVAYPDERLELRSRDPTLEAIEWLTPLGRGSRAVIVGAARAGKTETLRRLLSVMADREDLELTLVLAGARPEEIAEWQEGPVQPAAALSFAASADAQGRAVEQTIEAAKRVCARGGDALVLIDTLDGLHPQAVRKALVAARNLRDGGSLTLIATATRPFGGETTVISLDVALTSSGREPIIDLVNSSTFRAELLVGEDGAKAIVRARAAALEALR